MGTQGGRAAKLEPAIVGPDAIATPGVLQHAGRIPNFAVGPAPLGLPACRRLNKYGLAHLWGYPLHFIGSQFNKQAVPNTHANKKLVWAAKLNTQP